VQIQLDKVREEPFSWDLEESIPSASLNRDELLELSPVRWSGTIRATTEGFLLSGRLVYDQTLACTRCLGPIEDHVDSEVHYLVKIRRALPLAGEFQLSEEDFDNLEVESETLDTDQIVLDQLQLNIPMRQLCRPDCAGLCPHCGVNRNLESCECAQDELDPRWQHLAELRDQFASRH